MFVLLVDSDPANIKNFRAYIRANFPEIKITGNFTDPSKDIVAMLKDEKVKPQLILADVKFFGGAFFTRYRDIHDHFPEIRFLMYGTYDETDYMKRAGEFGVLDYMYRPVKPGDLSRCLNLALKYFRKSEENEKESKQLAQGYESDMKHFEAMFLRALVEGLITNEREIMDGFAYFNIPPDKEYTAAVVHIDHFRQVALTLTEREKHLLIFKIQQIAREEFQNAFTVMLYFHSVAAVLRGRRAADETTAVCRNIKQIIYEKTGIRVSVGIGRGYGTVTDIAVSYREALAALRYRIRVGYNEVITIQSVEPSNYLTYRYPAEREERLVYMAVVGDYPYCKQLLLELFDALAQGGTLPDMLISRVLMNIVLRISRYISEQNLPFANMVGKIFPTAELLSVRNLEEGLRFFDKSLENFCAFIREYNEKSKILTE